MGIGENKNIAEQSLFGSWEAGICVEEKLAQLQNMVQCAP